MAKRTALLALSACALGQGSDMVRLTSAVKKAEPEEPKVSGPRRPECVDRDHQCEYWATIGECKANPRYMLVNCPVSCHSCNGDVDEGSAPHYRQIELRYLQPQGEFQRINGKLHFLRELSFNPRIYTIDDFLSPAECEELKQLALPHLEEANTINGQTGLHQLDKARNNWQMHFTNQQHLVNGTINTVVDRMHRLTRIPYGHAEHLQVGRYRVGEYYEPHFDSTVGAHVRRAATVLVYLESPEEGGATIFPKRRNCAGENFEACCRNLDELVVGEGSGLWVPAKQGQAVLFYSHDADGRHNSLGIHGACPVLSGEKWVAQQWFRVEPYEGSPHATQEAEETESPLIVS